MNELKPEDVMRALEHCADYKSAEVSCVGCPIYGRCFDEPNLLEISALALLREKDALIKDLKDNTEVITEMIEMLNNVIEEKDAEIERLQNDLAISKKETKRYITSHKQTRAEAITEFAERLKEALNKVPTDYGRWEIGDVLHVIDHLGGFKYQERVDTIRDVKDLYKRVCADAHIKQYRGYTATKSYGYDTETQKIVGKEGEFWFNNPFFCG